MKGLFPSLHLSVNGGITTLREARAFLDNGLDGVMLGRAAYHNPADVLGPADRVIFGTDTPDRAPEEAVQAMLPYIEAHLTEGGKLHQITRHMLGLFTGRPGARAWRRVLSQGATRPGAGPELVQEALSHITTAPAL